MRKVLGLLILSTAFVRPVGAEEVVHTKAWFMANTPAREQVLRLCDNDSGSAMMNPSSAMANCNNALDAETKIHLDRQIAASERVISGAPAKKPTAPIKASRPL